MADNQLPCRPRVKGRFVKATDTDVRAPEGNDQAPDTAQEEHIMSEDEADEEQGTEWPDVAHEVFFNSGDFDSQRLPSS